MSSLLVATAAPSVPPVVRDADDAALHAREEGWGLYSWQAGWRGQPPDNPLGHGYTVGDMVRFHERPATPPGARYMSRVAYGTAGPQGRPLHMYVYARADATERAPGVLFIHGGGWSDFTPFMLIRYAAALAEAGFVAATCEYRLRPEARWPASIQDCKAAVRWLRAHHGEIGLDPDRLAASGNSAGGHLAAMLGVTPGRFEGEGGNAAEFSGVQALALIYPAIDMLHPEGSIDLRNGFGQIVGDPSESGIAAANPPTYLSAECPPVLTVTGDLDTVTTLPSIQGFHDRLDELGVANQLVVYPGREHVFDLLPWEWFDVTSRIRDFLSAHL